MSTWRHAFCHHGAIEFYLLEWKEIFRFDLENLGDPLEMRSADSADPGLPMLHLLHGDSRRVGQRFRAHSERDSLRLHPFADLSFGMGMSAPRIADTQRRDRLFLLNALAIVSSALLPAAGESFGMDRLLKVDTAKRRTHSLFRQGCRLQDLMANMPEHRLRPLIDKFLAGQRLGPGARVRVKNAVSYFDLIDNLITSVGRLFIALNPGGPK